MGDDDTRNAVNGQLRMAAQRGNVGLLEEVLANYKDKVDLNSKDGLGNTALHNAAQAGHILPLEILIKHDASTNVQNNAGQTPLHLACSRSFKPGVEALLKAGADPNIMDLEKRKAHNFAHKKDIRDLLQAREKTTFTLAPITTSGKPASAASASAAPATTAAATGGSIFLADMSMAVNLDDDDGDDDDEPEEDDD